MITLSDLKVLTWAERPVATSVKPYVDRLFFTDIGVGGSEWYSDGTRWCAVGGQVILKSLKTTVSIPTVSWSASTGTKDFALDYSIPAGLLNAGDIIECEALVNCSEGTSVQGLYLNFFVAGSIQISQISNATLTYNANANTNINTNSRACMIGAARLDSSTLISGVRPASPAGFGVQANSMVLRQAVISNVSTNALPITAKATATTASTGTLAIESYTITLKTCG
jgi:hypothetical protein